MPQAYPAMRCSSDQTALLGEGFADLNTSAINLTTRPGRPCTAPQLTVVSNDTAGTLEFTAEQEGGYAFVAQIRANSDKAIALPLTQIDAGNGALTAECYWLSDSLARNPV